jgi:hypothetical protein
MSEYYRMETDSYIFYLTISKGVGIHTLSIGGKKSGCVNVSVNTSESLAVQRGFHKVDIATIPILGWDIQCAVDKYLPKGVGTVHMIRSILSESVRLYPHVNKYTFTDTSHLQCDNGNEISLLALSVVKHKKTWYERNFHAYIVDGELRKKYHAGLQMLDDPALKVPFYTFTIILQSYKFSKEFQNIYEESSTYSDIFRQIEEIEGDRGLCNSIVGWIRMFIQYIFQFDPHSVLWGIDKEFIPKIQSILTELPSKPHNQFGGKRSTRKGHASRVNINDILEMSL